MSQNFDSTVSKYFFDADLKIRDSTLITFFETNPLFSIEVDSFHTTFSLEDFSDKTIGSHFYGFSNHPYLHSPFRNGRIGFTTIKTVDYIVFLHFSLLLFFQTQEKQEAMFNFIKNDFSLFPTKKIDMRNTGLIEMFRFTDTVGRKSISLSRGELNNAFYINLFLSNSTE